MSGVHLNPETWTPDICTPDIWTPGIAQYIRLFSFVEDGIYFCKSQCATGSKIPTEPEPDRIGIILAGTGPDYKPEKVNRIRPDRPDLPDFYRIFLTFTLNLQVTNINMAASILRYESKGKARTRPDSFRLVLGQKFGRSGLKNVWRPKLLIRLHLYLRNLFLEQLQK